MLLMVLVEARKEKMLEFKKTLDPDLLEEIHVLKRLIKKVFELVTGEKVLPSLN